MKVQYYKYGRENSYLGLTYLKVKNNKIYSWDHDRWCREQFMDLEECKKNLNIEPISYEDLVLELL